MGRKPRFPCPGRRGLEPTVQFTDKGLGRRLPIWHGDRMALDRFELDLAAAQGGVVTRSQLLEAGRSSNWIDRQIDVGRLVKVKDGVYRAIEMRNHMDLLRAALVTLPDATVSHESAAHLLHFPVLPTLRPTVTVHTRTTHSFPGVIVRRNSDLLAQHTIRVQDLKTTNLLRTTFDLAGVLDETVFDGIVEGLVLAGRLDLDTLGAFGDSLRRRGKPGSRAVTAVIERRRALTGSKLERLGLTVLRKGGVPDPVLEYPAPWNDRERIDAAWPAARTGIEWDSKAWHESRKHMRNDRRRDRQAVLNGWVILRYTWTDLSDRPDSVVAEVRRVLLLRS